MCQSQSFIKKSRHRFEIPLFITSAILTLIVAISVITATVYKAELIQASESTIIDDYRAEHSNQTDVTDAMILEDASDDEKVFLDTIRDLKLPLIICLPIIIFFGLLFTIGKMYGGLRGNGVQITPEQFGDVHAVWVELAQELGFKKIPELYLENGNGALNAYATCVPGYRRFGAVYSDILERVLANDDLDSLKFILGHELGHIRLGHVYWWYSILTIIGNMPVIKYFIGLPMSRAREYGCDKLGHHLSKDTQCKGLLMLASGKHLYKKVDLAAYEQAQVHTHNIWDAASNVGNDHPIISWRIAALRQQRHGDLIWAKKQYHTFSEK